MRGVVAGFVEKKIRNMVFWDVVNAPFIPDIVLIPSSRGILPVKVVKAIIIPCGKSILL